MILGVTFALLFYLATAVLLVGLVRRILFYIRTPAPLVIPTTPAPTTRIGVVGRILREVTLFESLFKGSKWTWLFSWLFHFGMLIVVLEHLRYVTEPVWWWLSMFFVLPVAQVEAWSKHCVYRQVDKDHSGTMAEALRIPRSISKMPKEDAKADCTKENN